MHGALIRYRIIAWVVGVVLLVLVLVAMPVKYLGHNDTLVAAVGPIHGFLFMVYVALTFDLGRRALAAGPDAARHARRHDPVPVLLGRTESEPFLDSE